MILQKHDRTNLNLWSLAKPWHDTKLVKTLWVTIADILSKNKPWNEVSYNDRLFSIIHM